MATTPITTTTTPPSTPVIINLDYLNDSWCELQYKSSCSSTGSISHINHSVNPEILEKLLQEAIKELPESEKYSELNKKCLNSNIDANTNHYSSSSNYCILINKEPINIGCHSNIKKSYNTNLLKQETQTQNNLIYKEIEVDENINRVRRGIRH